MILQALYDYYYRHGNLPQNDCGIPLKTGHEYANVPKITN